MPDWQSYKGVEIPEAVPPNMASLRLKENFIYVADKLDALQSGLTSLILGDLAGVDITSPTPGQVLAYDGSDWTQMVKRQQFASSPPVFFTSPFQQVHWR